MPRSFCKKRDCTRLNGESPEQSTADLQVCETKAFPETKALPETKGSPETKALQDQIVQDNPVLNRIQALRPKKQPGIYMVFCIENDWRYYGESINVSGRLASHKSLLIRQIHPNKALQHDWNVHGPDKFSFIVLHIGDKWSDPAVRRGKELEYITLNRSMAYNVLDGIQKPGEKNPFWGKTHSEETKQKIRAALTGIPNDKLGKKVSIKGTLYASIAEASRQTSHSRKLIRKRLLDSDFPDWYET